MNRAVDEAQQPNSENQELIDQFVEITSVNRDQARFYLETAGFDLALALSGFYEGGFDEDAIVEDQPEVIFDRQQSDNEGDDVQIVEEPTEESHLEARRRVADINTNRSGEMSGGKDQKKKFATLFSQDGAGGRESGSSSDDEDKKGQAFYVGGSERSGQQVLGPPKQKAEPKLADKFFQQAKERGAEQIDPSQRNAAASAAGSSSSTFGGAGYRLGDAVKPSEKIGGKSEEGEDTEAQTVTVIMRMYQNGFTIGDEPLRTFEGAADRQFLQHIMQGRLPPELIQAHPGKRIDLEMEDHRHEDYKPPKGIKAFAGQGHALGSPIPDVVGAGKVTSKAPAAVAQGASANVDTPAILIPVDESKPITNIQVRLGNGERLVLKLNHTHTVKQLREFICRMRPDLANRQFVLMTSFPSKELTDESISLEGASLLNAVIIQRFK